MKHPDCDAAIEALKTCKSETVPASMIAPVLNMDPGVIVKYAKDGKWDADRLGNFVISGNRVKFFRRDFLQKFGLIDPEKEEVPADLQILKQLIDLNEGVTMICQMLTLMMEPYQLDALNELIEKKDRRRWHVDGPIERSTVI